LTVREAWRIHDASMSFRLPTAAKHLWRAAKKTSPVGEGSSGR